MVEELARRAHPSESQSASGTKGFSIVTLHLRSTLRFGTGAGGTVSFPSMSCVSFSDRRTVWAFAASSNPISFPFRSCAFYASRALFKSQTACCFENTFKHGSKKRKEGGMTTLWKPKSCHSPFLTFRTPSLRLLSYLHLSSRCSLASCTHQLCLALL